MPGFFKSISVTLYILFLLFMAGSWGAYLCLAEVKWVKTGVKPLLGVRGWIFFIKNVSVSLSTKIKYFKIFKIFKKEDSTAQFKIRTSSEKNVRFVFFI